MNIDEAVGILNASKYGGIDNWRFDGFFIAGGNEECERVLGAYAAVAIAEKIDRDGRKVEPLVGTVPPLVPWPEPEGDRPRLCQCGARPRVEGQPNSDLRWVECDGCGFSGPAFASRRNAVSAWNQVVRWIAEGRERDAAREG